jgi:cysteine sulfinate desulfinase/cysteine desulfurase-like protein
MYASKGNHNYMGYRAQGGTDSCKSFKKELEITVLPTDREGKPDLAERKAIRPTTILICMMLANNETGAVCLLK